MRGAHWSKDGKNTLCGLTLVGKLTAEMTFAKPPLGPIVIAIDFPGEPDTYCPVCARLATEVGLPPILINAITSAPGEPAVMLSDRDEAKVTKTWSMGHASKTEGP